MDQELDSVLKVPLELIYAALLADDAYLKNPTDENLLLADLAAERVRHAERQASWTSRQSDDTPLPYYLGVRLASIHKTYLENPTKENKSMCDNVWNNIQSALANPIAFWKAELESEKQELETIPRTLRRTLFWLCEDYLKNPNQLVWTWIRYIVWIINDSLDSRPFTWNEKRLKYFEINVRVYLDDPTEEAASQVISSIIAIPRFKKRAFDPRRDLLNKT